jgi:hypothetical protein
MTDLVVQIPWEITVPGEAPLPTEIIINDNGTQSHPFLVVVVPNQVQILKTCMISGQYISAQYIACVTHADGSIVWANAPAQPGEIVVVYALGLGPVSNTPKTGDATPMPSPTQGLSTLLDGLAIQFDFRPNASPSSPFVHPTIKLPGITSPIFAGLTPGQVGLYQINVQLPDTFPAVPPCEAVTLEVAVRSNLTIDIGHLPGSQEFVDSFDGAAICVQSSQ